MDDFNIHDGNVDNLLPNEAGSSAFEDYDEDARIDEDLKQQQDERHMIRSAGPLLDNILEWFDDKINELDKNSTVHQVLYGYELHKHPSGHGHEIASRSVEIARKHFVDKRNELLNLQNIHIPDSQR